MAITKLSQEEYDALSTEQREEYDKKARAQELAEQAALPYRWNQRLSDVDVAVEVPEGTRGRDLVVEIKRKKIKVGLKGKEPIMEGELSKEIKEEDSTWTLEDNKLVEIHLEKVNKNEWWPHVLTKDPKIDTTKIVPENSKLSDLDGETRAMVEKMMFDNRQKQMGQPTSDQMKQNELLAKLQASNPAIDFSNAKIN